MNTPHRPSILPKSLTRQILRIGCFAVLVLHLTVSSSLAQTGAATTAPVASEAAASKEKEAIVLAPFEVVSSNDDGWLAGNTMLTNRVNSPLKETPISIDALTKEFLTDVGAFNENEAGQWVANVEIQPDIFQNDLGAFNFRGMTNQFSANRNFFRWYGPQDGYNVERLDVGRGSNTLIFGDNDPGGQATVYTKQALPGRTFTKVLAQTGSWGSYRGEFDHNRVLIKDRLAVRLNLANKTDYRDFDWNKFNYRGYHGTLTYRPFSNTILRLEGERSGNYRIWGANDLLIRERANPGMGFSSAAVSRLTVLPSGFVVDSATTAGGTPDGTRLPDGTTYLRARDRTATPAGTVLNYLDHDTVTPLGSAFTFEGLPRHYAFSGPASVNNRTYATWSAFLEHRFTSAFAMDVAVNQQNQWEFVQTVGSTTIGNADLFGRLYTDQGLQLTNRRNHMTQYRVSLVYNFTRWKWMKQSIVMRGEYRDDRNNNLLTVQRTFGPNYPAAGIRPFQRVFFTDPYPAAALTTERFYALAPPNTRDFGLTGSGQNHLSRAFSFSSQGKYLGGRFQTLLGARYDTNDSWTYQGGRTADPMTGEQFQLGDRHDRPDLFAPIRAFLHRGWTYSGSVVFLATKAVNIYFTQSTSYRFGGQDNLILEPTGPLEGLTQEIGLKGSWLKDRLAWNLAAYDLQRDGVPLNITRTGITDAQMDAVINYGVAPGSPDYRAVRTGGASPDITTQRSRGIEGTLTFYPVKGFSVRLSGAHKEVTFVDAFPVLKQLLAATEARGPITDPDVAATIAKLKDVSIVQAAAGRKVTGQFPAVTAPWSFNTVLGYRFGSETRLKGWSVGVNGRYSSDSVLRYLAPFPDPRHIKGGETYTVGGSMGWRTKIFARPTSFHLNLYNIAATEYPVLTSAALADGSNYFRRYYGQPFSYRFTASMEF